MNPFPPGLAGFVAAQQQGNQNQSQQLGLLAQLSQMQEQSSQRQQAEQVRGILAQSASPEAAIPLLMKAGPAGIQAATSLAQLAEHSAKAAGAQREMAHYSPENLTKYVTPGRPEISLPEEITGPVMPAQPAAMNLDAFRRDAAMLSPKGMETYSQHQAQQAQAKEAGLLRRDTLAQTAQSRRDTLDTQLQIARERSEDRALSQAEQNKARMDMIRLTASLRQAPAPSPLESIVGPDGKPVLVPRAQAVGQQPAGKGAPERAMPASAVRTLMENQQNLRRAEQALSLVQGKVVGGATGDTSATGVKGLLSTTEIGDQVLQRLDPKGVDTRAAISDLGSMIIHDRSGAAVTAAEYPRLRPFIPKVTDDAATAKKKLERFVAEYRNVQRETVDFFQESGYKVPTESLRPPPEVTPPANAPKNRASDEDLIRKYLK